MLSGKAFYQPASPSQTWLNISAWIALASLSITGWFHKGVLNDWLMGGNIEQVAAAPGEDAPSVPNLLPFPLELPGPEQLAAWRAMALHWGPIIAVWLLIGTAGLGVAWLSLTLLLRLFIWRPRACGRFTLSHAQELATQTIIALVALGVLASSYFIPIDYLGAVIPAGLFLLFCTAIPGEKGWFTWGKLFGEWGDALRWRPRHRDYEIPYEPPPPAVYVPHETLPPAKRASPQLLRLRKRLEKVESQVLHKSTHPNQREAARHARQTLMNKIAEIEKEE